MFLVAVAFLIGDCAVQSLPALPPMWPWAAVLALSGGAAAPFRRTRWIAAMLLGAVWSGLHGHARLTHDLPAQFTRLDAEVVGDISSLVAREEYGLRFQFDVISATGALAPPLALRRLELTWYDAEQAPQPGERWRLQVRLRARQGYANPGGYDYEGQLFRRGVGATGYVRAGRNERLQAVGWRYPVLRARAYIADCLTVAASPSTQRGALGVLQGLAVGETSRIDAAQWRAFAATGTTHLMAISGLHIAMVAMSAAWLVGLIARRLPLQRWRANALAWQAVGGLSAAAMYSALAGWSAPTQRTLVMLGVYFIMRLRRRKQRASQGFALALIGVLLVDPFAPLAAGFWLSFGAVAAIMLNMAGRSGRLGKLSEFVRLQGAVTVGMTPLLLSIFGGMSLVAPAVNLLAIPVFTCLLTPCALLAGALGAIHPTLGIPLARAFEATFDVAWPLLERAAQLPLAMWHFPQLPVAMTGVLVAGCALCIAPGAFMLRAVGGALCAAALCWQPERPARGEFELTVLDVGQGLSVVVQTAEHTLLYDAGPAFRSGRDAGELAVLPYLRARGVRKIDALLASHGDADHVGGLDAVLSDMRIERIFAGPSVVGRAAFDQCRQGQSWRWDDVEFAIVHPNGAALHGKDNDTSCVLQIRGRGGGASIFGDIERNAEEALAASGALRPTDVVIVPHHGSNTSSTSMLVDATQARYALISAGVGNRWGFPKPEVLTRWRQAGAETFSTADSGALMVTVAASGAQRPRQQRQAARRYWRR